MLEPGFYPNAPNAVELRETHASWVFLAGELAYKVKKPVTLLVPRLRHARAPQGDVPRGGAAEPAPRARLLPRRGPVVRGEGAEARRRRAGRAVEYAVRMNRVPEERTLERRIARR